MDVEARRCRAQAVSISIYGATAPRSLLGGLAAQNMSLLHYCYSDALLFFFILHVMLSETRQVSPSQPETKPLTSGGHFILVCNIVCVPIVALYHVYRLLKRRKNV